ncbi:unnamed protein product [Didymodactylos carnosus]|uniref:Uncharacterized protein n=1 Tax=Didymodactylos carnosus TaxID=1234261 RepID=A0A814ITN9_9BILA|nr:unnamed protein product [Didymodactylos carnosus]CAF1432570.1 unnamed protein product [Didymodactylos carnosus]CAF3799661.1 unnamed protein product [Didymodactylos carnosus]CAF4230392.1 unnamed protein product [Didymodactylos carnosus]
MSVRLPHDNMHVRPSLSVVTVLATKEHNFTIDCQTCHFHDESDKGVTGGHLRTYDEFRVSHDHVPRKIHVLIPIDYLSNNQAKRYLVIYMNDGQTAFWNGGLVNKSWNVGQTVSKIYEKDDSKQGIVVAIHPLDRNREYTHTHWMWKQAYGGVDDYNDNIVNNVKPWIDKNYRTLPTAKRTVIAGI